MSKLTEQWIELFRAGNYGDKGSYDASQLDEIVRNYDPSFHEAPAVIGHPKDNLPAYGWVEAVKREGSMLMGKLKQVQPDFEQMVESGRFKKRSIGLYQTAKGLALRHVGFLGAQPPEIKGLADVRFDDKGNEFTEVDFEEEVQMAGEEKTMLDQLKAFFAGRESAVPITAPTKTFSEADITKAVQDAVKPFADQVTALGTKLTAQATTFAESEQKRQLAEIGVLAANAVARLKSEGKWIPAFDTMGVAKLFSELAKSQVIIEFSEGETKVSRSLFDTAVSIFGALPKIVPGGTLVLPGQHRGGGTFSEAPGSRTAADPNSVQLTQLTKARQKEKNITFAEALSQVIVENPELTVPGGMAAGKV